MMRTCCVGIANADIRGLSAESVAFRGIAYSATVGIRGNTLDFVRSAAFWANSALRSEDAEVIIAVGVPKPLQRALRRRWLRSGAAAVVFVENAPEAYEVIGARTDLSLDSNAS